MIADVSTNITDPEIVNLLFLGFAPPCGIAEALGFASDFVEALGKGPRVTGKRALKRLDHCLGHAHAPAIRQFLGELCGAIVPMCKAMEQRLICVYTIVNASTRPIYTTAGVSTRHATLLGKRRHARAAAFGAALWPNCFTSDLL